MAKYQRAQREAGQRLWVGVSACTCDVAAHNKNRDHRCHIRHPHNAGPVCAAPRHAAAWPDAAHASVWMSCYRVQYSQ